MPVARWTFAPCLAFGLLLAGCGLNKSRLATEQLVVSDAVDRAVAEIDFTPLSGRKVYFDTKYLDGVKLSPAGNIEYVVSSLRQQMAAYDLRLQEKPEQAEFIVEARVGVMANDGHEVTYGIPGSAAMTTASVFLTSPVAAPAMPELSLGRRNHQQGTAKIGLFAYDRQTREPVWQSGLAKGASRARDLWLFGLGPFENRGPVRRTAGRSGKNKQEIGVSNHASDPLDSYAGSVVFERAVKRDAPQPESDSPVQPAAHHDPAASELAPSEPAKLDHQNVPLKPAAGAP
ncbi:MAG: hypothetical protein L0211_13140 [Planctomycetaceae bacterium]|nr:hypothetical protein [Planctomycetaceae bacterium]